MVDENPSHEIRRNGEEVRAILPADGLSAGQAQKRLMNERCRLQSVIGILAPHALLGGG